MSAQMSTAMMFGAFCRQHLRVRPPLASRRSADQHDLARLLCPSLAFPQNVNTSDPQGGPKLLTIIDRRMGKPVRSSLVADTG